MREGKRCIPPFRIVEDLPDDIGKRTLQLMQVFHRLHKINLFEKLGISKGEFITLSILADYQKEHPEKEGVYVSYIAKKQCVANSQISRMLKTMEEDGLIKRKVAKEDRRNTYVFLTHQGNQVVEEVKRKMEQFYYRVIKQFGKENIEELIRLCEKIANIMEKEM